MIIVASDNNKLRRKACVINWNIGPWPHKNVWSILSKNSSLCGYRFVVSFCQNKLQNPLLQQNVNVLGNLYIPLGIIKILLSQSTIKLGLSSTANGLLSDFQNIVDPDTIAMDKHSYYVKKLCPLTTTNRGSFGKGSSMTLRYSSVSVYKKNILKNSYGDLKLHISVYIW